MRGRKISRSSWKGKGRTELSELENRAWNPTDHPKKEGEKQLESPLSWTVSESRPPF